MIIFSGEAFLIKSLLTFAFVCSREEKAGQVFTKVPFAGFKSQPKIATGILWLCWVSKSKPEQTTTSKPDYRRRIQGVMDHIDRSLREYSVLVLRMYSYEKIKATFFPSIKFQISKYDRKELSKDEPGRVVATTNDWKTTPDGQVNNGAMGFSTNEL